MSKCYAERKVLAKEFNLSGDTVKAEATGGFYKEVDLGIVKYHFEVGAGKENFTWA